MSWKAIADLRAEERKRNPQASDIAKDKLFKVRYSLTQTGNHMEPSHLDNVVYDEHARLRKTGVIRFLQMYKNEALYDARYRRVYRFDKLHSKYWKASFFYRNAPWWYEYFINVKPRFLAKYPRRSLIVHIAEKLLNVWWYGRGYISLIPHILWFVWHTPKRISFWKKYFELYPDDNN